MPWPKIRQRQIWLQMTRLRFLVTLGNWPAVNWNQKPRFSPLYLEKRNEKKKSQSIKKIITQNDLKFASILSSF